MAVKVAATLAVVDAAVVEVSEVSARQKLRVVASLVRIVGSAAANPVVSAQSAMNARIVENVTSVVAAEASAHHAANHWPAKAQA